MNESEWYVNWFFCQIMFKILKSFWKGFNYVIDMHFYSSVLTETSTINLTTTGGFQGISSENYPNRYPNRDEPIFTILSPVGTAVRITFLDVELEQPSVTRCFDRLWVYDGTLINLIMVVYTCFEENISRKQNKISQLCRIFRLCIIIMEAANQVAAYIIRIITRWQSLVTFDHSSQSDRLIDSGRSSLA